MRHVFNILKQDKKQMTVVSFLIFVVCLLRVATSVIQVYSFNRLVAMDFRGFLTIELLTLVLWIVLLVINYFSNMTKQKFVTECSHNLRKNYISHMAVQDYQTFKEKSPSDIASVLDNDVEMIENQALSSYFSLYETLLLMVFSLVALFLFHYLIPVVTLVLTLVVTFVPQLLSKRAQKASETFLGVKRAFLEDNLDILNGFSVFFSSNKMELMTRFVTGNSDTYRKGNISYTKVQESIGAYIATISITSQMALSLFTGYLVTQGLVSLGVVGSVGSIAANVFNSLTALSGYYLAINSVKNVLATLPKEESKIETIDSHPQFQSLQLQNLTLKYDGRTILDNLNLDIKKHEKIAIIGESGAGKSSLFNVLTKRVKHDEGQVMLNQKPLDTYSEREIASVIGYLSGEKVLFRDTILNNITLFQTVDETQLQKVLEWCHLEQMDLSLNLKENALSDGEKQRVVLARLLLLNRDVYFIDEGLSQLDEKNAIYIERNLLSIPNKTVVLITHHLHVDNLVYYDRIIDLSKGHF